MQVSVGQEGPGYMPWSNAAEVWVGWCYPYPRPVQVNPHFWGPKSCRPALSEHLAEKPEKFGPAGLAVGAVLLEVQRL